MKTLRFPRSTKCSTAFNRWFHRKRLWPCAAPRIVGVALTVSVWGWSADWPQWLGPGGSSVWEEEGILERFPETGLEIKWRVPVGLGYAGPAVAEGRVYVMDYVKRSGTVSNNPGQRDQLSGRERVLCLSGDNGRVLWQYEYERPYSLSFPGGPRCTPAIDAGKVYTLGAEGTLLCLDAKQGKVVWQKDLKREYRTQTPQWGFAGHPLVAGSMLYCLVGGEGSVAVALDKSTGREIWRALTAKEPGYCPPSLIEAGGVRQLLIWHPEAIHSLNPQTGEGYWSIPLKPDYAMSIATPRKSGPYLFASGIRTAAVLVQLNENRPAAEVMWRGDSQTALYASLSTPFLEKGIIYGVDYQRGELVAVRMEDGRRLWQTTRPTVGEGEADNGTAFLVKHRDRFFLFNEKGDLIQARLTAQGYEELGRFHVLEPTSQLRDRKVVWSHPAFARQCVFARNDEELVCVNLAADP